MRSALATAALVALAAAVALVRIPARVVEYVYSTGFYPLIESGVVWVSNLVPFAVMDVAVGAGVAAFAWALYRDIAKRTTWWRVIGRFVRRGLVIAAGGYLAFAALWGLNYQRQRLPEKVLFDESRITPDGARELASQAVDSVNALYASAHQELSDGDAAVQQSLRTAYVAVQRSLGMERLAHPARPKRTLIDPYFRSAAVAGFTDPIFFETIIASSLLPVERPFTTAHEWAHLAGFTDEGEAHFVGWLTCLQGSPAARYSGWLFLFQKVANALPSADRAAAVERLDAGPLADIRAIQARLQRDVKPRIARAGARVYNQYLKANRVAAGIASYDEVIRLVLGTKFDSDGFPQLR